MEKEEKSMEGKEKMSYVRGNKTNVTPVTILQNGKPRPKPIKQCIKKVGRMEDNNGLDALQKENAELKRQLEGRRKDNTMWKSIYFSVMGIAYTGTFMMLICNQIEISKIIFYFLLFTSLATSGVFLWEFVTYVWSSICSKQ